MRTPLRVTGSIVVLFLFCIVSNSEVRAQRETVSRERTPFELRASAWVVNRDGG
jgi:hypothetical protein